MSNDWSSKDLKKFKEIDYFFHPKSVCLIGAGKSNPLTVSSIILSNILTEKFIGPVYLVDVQPQADKIQGLEVHSSISKIKDEIDLSLIITPAVTVPSVIEDCIDANVKNIIIITAGFSESHLYDQGGVKLQEEIDKRRKKTKIRIVGPNCNGVYSQDCSLNATLGPRLILPPGNFSLVTRGGTAGIILSVAAARQNLGINKYIGIGGESDLLLQDFLHYFEYDNSTKIMGAYSEGIKDPKSFNEVLKKIQKPIVFYKSGETSSGARAASSHVGAIAGSFTTGVAEGLLKQLRIVKAISGEEFIDFVAAAARTSLPRGNNVAIWTPGGSMGVIMSDHLEREGLKVAKLTKDQITNLSEVLKVKYWSHNNPVDVTDSYNPQAIDKSARILLAGNNFDGLIVLFGFAMMEKTEYLEFGFANQYRDMLDMFMKQQAKRFGRLIKKYQKPIFILANEEGKMARIFQKEGVIVLPTFRRIARTFRMLHQQYVYDEIKKKYRGNDKL